MGTTSTTNFDVFSQRTAFSSDGRKRPSAVLLFRSVLAAVAVVTLGITPTVAWAQSAGAGVVVHVEGPDRAGLQEDLQAALPKGETPADEGKFLQALRKEGGPKPPLTGKLDSARERRALTAKVRRALRAAGARTAVLVASRRGRGNKATVYLLVVDASTEGEAAVDKELTVAAGKERREAGCCGGFPILAVRRFRRAPASRGCGSQSLSAHRQRGEARDRIRCFAVRHCTGNARCQRR